MASLLADGLNLGLTRMAEACSIASLGQLAWTADWHIRDETYALALPRLINQQQREPLAAMFWRHIGPPGEGVERDRRHVRALRPGRRQFRPIGRHDQQLRRHRKVRIAVLGRWHRHQVGKQAQIPFNVKSSIARS
jgi:hypothetical protein